MMSYLCLTIRFLQPYYHGRCDGAQPEWPPSPLRLFQALVAASAQRWRDAKFRDDIKPALQWLERLPAHTVVAADAKPAKAKYRLYVPDNVADKVATSWSGGRDASIADYRTEKDVCPTYLSAEAIHYLFPLADGRCPHLQILTAAARSITHLGWGVDMVAADVSVISEREAATLPGERWHPAIGSGMTVLRTPIPGTLDALIARHQAFLNRISRDARGNESFNPVPPLSVFRVVEYRRATDPVARPSVVFELRNDDDSFYSYPHHKLIHIAGMVRHLAIEAMKQDPPEADVPGDWVETYVAGHVRRGEQQEIKNKCLDNGCPPNIDEHRQFSYLPLPSIGHAHTDPSIRRVMIVAPLGDDRFLRHLARKLAGRQLKPLPQTRLDFPPTLVRVQNDQVACLYTQSANTWASVTPVILPGHDDHKPEKTRRLIEKALAQSGVEQPCQFEWRAVSWFPKSLTAHKYDHNKRLTGYLRPDHLLSQTAVHLKLRFDKRLKVPGPLVIGAGRHCGLGLFAAIDNNGD